MGEVVQADITPHWAKLLPAERMAYLNAHVLGSNHGESGREAEVVKLSEFRHESTDCKCSYCEANRCPDCGCIRRGPRCDCNPLGAA